MCLYKNIKYHRYTTHTTFTVYTAKQAVPIEGKYWKRRSEAVATEYKKWRLYYKQKRMFNQRRVQQNTAEVPTIVDLVSLLSSSYCFISLVFVLSSGQFGRDAIKSYGVCPMMYVNFIVY